MLGRSTLGQTWETGTSVPPTGGSAGGSISGTGSPGSAVPTSRTSSSTTVLGKECRITGRVELGGTATVEGTLTGELISSGELIIGETASVEAKISARRVQIFGRVTGDVTCSERLELRQGAKVLGNISSPSLTIEDGVMFEGQCSMQNKS